MTALAWLVPAALILGGLVPRRFSLGAPLGPLEDLKSAAYRALEDDPPDR